MNITTKKANPDWGWVNCCSSESSAGVEASPSRATSPGPHQKPFYMLKTIHYICRTQKKCSDFYLLKLFIISGDFCQHCPKHKNQPYFLCQYVGFCFIDLLMGKSQVLGIRESIKRRRIQMESVDLVSSRFVPLQSGQLVSASQRVGTVGTWWRRKGWKLVEICQLLHFLIFMGYIVLDRCSTVVL